MKMIIDSMNSKVDMKGYINPASIISKANISVTAKEFYSLQKGILRNCDEVLVMPGCDDEPVTQFAYECGIKISYKNDCRQDIKEEICDNCKLKEHCATASDYGDYPECCDNCKIIDKLDAWQHGYEKLEEELKLYKETGLEASDLKLIDETYRDMSKELYEASTKLTKIKKLIDEL